MENDRCIFNLVGSFAHEIRNFLVGVVNKTSEVVITVSKDELVIHHTNSGFQSRMCIARSNCQVFRAEVSSIISLAVDTPTLANTFKQVKNRSRIMMKLDSNTDWLNIQIESGNKKISTDIKIIKKEPRYTHEPSENNMDLSIVTDTSVFMSSVKEFDPISDSVYLEFIKLGGDIEDGGERYGIRLRSEVLNIVRKQVFLEMDAIEAENKNFEPEISKPFYLSILHQVGKIMGLSNFIVLKLLPSKPLEISLCTPQQIKISIFVLSIDEIYDNNKKLEINEDIREEEDIAMLID